MEHKLLRVACCALTLCLFMLCVMTGYARLVTQQEKAISGNVTDKQTGELLVGATILVKSTGHTTVTNEDGFFSIIAAERDTLVVTFVSYEKLEIPIMGRERIAIALSVTSDALEEVVVVGYGTQKRSETTASVSTLKTSDVKNAPSANISNSLNGRLAGVIAAQGSGEPGSDGAEIHIRGVATTGNSAPLVIVDGVPRSFTKLDPSTIESFTVLKDAAAVAPYGMAGANGVILVTTKKGKSGQVSLEYNGYIGFQNPTTIVDMVNAYDYVRLRNIADITAGQAAPFSDEMLEGFRKSVGGAPDADYDKYPNTNAMDAIRNKNTALTNHSVAFSGGSDRITYYTGLGYLGQEGMWSTTQRKRYNLVTNIDAKVTETTKIGLSINAYNEFVNRPSSDPRQIFSNAQAWWPINALRYSNGLEAYNNGKRILHLLTTGSRASEQTQVMAQLTVDQEIRAIKGLSLKGVVSYDPTTLHDKNWNEPAPSSYSINTTTTPYEYTEVTVGGKPSLLVQHQRWKDYTLQGMINYNRQIGQHSITGLGVFEARRSDWDYVAASRGNYEFNVPEIDLGSSDKEDWGTGGTSSEARQVGYVYRITYGFNDRYFAEASGRYDGHYYFAPGKRFGFFPAFSLAWRLSEERFLKDNVDWVDQLKLRASYGESGNLAGGPFQYSNAMSLSGNAYNFGSSILQGVSERSEANPNITWERAMKSNIGLEGTLFNNLLSFEADYFYEKRNNMLVSPASVVPTEYGIGLAQINAGIMENRGLDLSVQLRKSFSDDLRVELAANFTYAKNKLIETFENAVTLNDPNRSRTGRPLNSQFALKAIRLYQADDFDENGQLRGFPIPTFGAVAPGDIMYADINGDGKVDVNDQTHIGHPILPQVIYGFNPRITYKNFDLNVLFQGAAQTNVQIQMELVWPFYVGASATQAVADDYWAPDNTDARFPRLFGQGGNANNQQSSSWWFYDASYLRIKNAELGYTLPTEIANTMKLRGIRIYAAGQNLATWSAIKKFIDPEMGQGGGGTDNNARGWYYPHQQVFSVGLNVQF